MRYRYAYGRATVAFAILATFVVPAIAQNADWQINPLPSLQGEWEYWGQENDRYWGGYAKIRIQDRTVTMVDPLHPEYLGSPWTRAPAGAVIMNIESWNQNRTTYDSQVIIHGICFDYSNGKGTSYKCQHALNKFGLNSQNRQGKARSWGFSIFQRLRDGATGAAGYKSNRIP